MGKTRGGSQRCMPGCSCGRHAKRTINGETRAKISAAARARGANHADDCACGWCGKLGGLRHGERPREGASPEYLVWQNMMQRCFNPNCPKFPDYGGRGITVCDHWQTFENFLADVGRRPSDDLSLDRIDNDGNYEPGNVRWATRSEQQRNKRRRRTVA